MKNGLIFENDELIYYKDDKPYHAGAIEIDGAIYYIGGKGRAVKGRHIVHREMGNGVLQRGTYTFGDDYKLIEGSFIPPKKKKKKKKKLSKSRQKTVSLIASAVLIVIGFVLVATIKPPTVKKAGNSQKQNQSSGETQNQSTEETQEEITVYLPTIEDPQLCSEGALKLYQGEVSVVTAVNEGDPYRAVKFGYMLKGVDGTLFVSESKNFTNATKYAMPENETVILLHNLKTGTKYYWKVEVGEDVYQGEFKTVPSTRFIYMEGAKNTRDIGGYVTLDGKTIKQGMIIRGTEIDGIEADGSNYFMKDEAALAAKETFGFVYDFDLRHPNIYAGEYQSKFGQEVRHRFYNAPQYAQIFSEKYADSLYNIFANLANPDNYPMYLHCAYGADRTGTIIFLLMGILNVSEEDMLREYQRTGFNQKSYADSDSMDAVIEGLRNYKGDTLQERIVSFLKSKGVTQAQIDSIREILLTE